MKTLLGLLLCAWAALTDSPAQDCLGMSFKPGMNFELTSFNAKDKPTGKILYQVKDVRREGGSTLMDMTAQIQDEKGRQQAPYTIRYTCTGDELLGDLSGMAQAMQNPGMQNMTLKLKTNRLVYPGKLSVGQKLPDGQMDADLLNGGSTMMEMSLTMANRQVDAQQQLTTPAGTFDTYKITSDMNFTNRAMGIPIRGTMRVVSYRSPKHVMDIRSETYNKNGKLMGYTLLSKAD